MGAEPAGVRARWSAASATARGCTRPATASAGRSRTRAQYDEAVNVYTQVTGAVATELAARAQLNIGLCRLAQKRYADAATALLVVPFTYDYPELSALALLEAARALQREQAGRTRP